MNDSLNILVKKTNLKNRILANSQVVGSDITLTK